MAFLKELNYVTVTIDNEKHELISEDKPEHVRRVAGYIDDKIKTLYSQKNNGYINPKQKTLFISLNIADDLFKEREKVSEATEEIAQLSESLEEILAENIKLKDENKEQTEKIQKMQKELEATKKELNEFIENFSTVKTGK